jgi:hypothetical protein
MTQRSTRTPGQLSFAFAAALGLGALAAPGCAVVDEGGETAAEAATRQMMQPVFVEPVFVIDGLDELPRGMRIETLRLGVGAIFLDLVEDQTGVAYANQAPFLLDFDLGAGDEAAYAPLMQLPRGGEYEVSVQLEPQYLGDGGASLIDAVAGAEPTDESSVVLSGYVEETVYIPANDGTIDEPVPLPWYPGVSELRREIVRTPFTYESARTVRFSVDHVTLTGGSRIAMVMHLDVAAWIEESLRPALDDVLGDRRTLAAIPGSDTDLGDDYIELHDTFGELGGEDSLIGGMDIVLR